MIRLSDPIPPAEHAAYERAAHALREAAYRLLPHASLLLFGSRARGDHHRLSDIDLMIIPKEGHCRTDESAFAAWIEESSQVLHRVDLVRWEDAGTDLRERVMTEGVVWKN